MSDVHFVMACGVVVLACIIASWTCVFVSQMLSDCSLCMYLFIDLFVLCACK